LSSPALPVGLSCSPAPPFRTVAVGADHNRGEGVAGQPAGSEVGQGRAVVVMASMVLPVMPEQVHQGTG
jgi:hypothetical protein